MRRPDRLSLCFEFSRLRWLNRVFLRPNSARYHCLPNVSINHAFTNDASNLRKKRNHFNKLTSVFYASVLLLIMNFVITLPRGSTATFNLVPRVSLLCLPWSLEDRPWLRLVTLLPRKNLLGGRGSLRTQTYFLCHWFRRK